VPELSYRVFTLRERLDDGMRAQRDAATMSARLAAARLARCHPQAQIAAERGRLTGCREALRTALTDRFDGMRLAVSSRGDVLGALDPHAVLRRGYAALHDAETTRPVFSVTQVTPGTRLEAVLADGAFEAVVALMPGGTGQRAGLSR
jgi:exodeoxyribonuclease VII large subunit